MRAWLSLATLLIALLPGLAPTPAHAQPVDVAALQQLKDALGTEPTAYRVLYQKLEALSQDPAAIKDFHFVEFLFSLQKLGTEPDPGSTRRMMAQSATNFLGEIHARGDLISQQLIAQFAIEEIKATEDGGQAAKQTVFLAQIVARIYWPAAHESASLHARFLLAALQSQDEAVRSQTYAILHQRINQAGGAELIRGMMQRHEALGTQFALKALDAEGKQTFAEIDHLRELDHEALEGRPDPARRELLALSIRSSLNEWLYSTQRPSLVLAVQTIRKLVTRDVSGVLDRGHFKRMHELAALARGNRDTELAASTEWVLTLLAKPTSLWLIEAVDCSQIVLGTTFKRVD